MTDKDNDTVRAVAWSEVCPWLAIFRTFRLAISVRILVFAAVATLLTSLAWALFGWAFSSIDPESQQRKWSEATQWTQPYAACPWRAVTDDLVPDQPNLPGLSLIEKPSMGTLWPTLDPMFRSWKQLSRPLWEIFNPRATLSDLACLLLCGLSALAIWAFFGGAIVRTAAVQLATDERVGWGAALRHACVKWPAYFGAPLFPLCGIVLTAIPAVVLGLLLRGAFGVFLAGLIWPLLLVIGLIMAMLLLGLLFGWPLMWTTIGAEGTDSFDALSRSYAYVFQRPLHYLFYAFVAAVFGALGWLLVQNFAAGVVGLTYWAASWGSGAEHMASITGAGEPLSGMGAAGTALIHFWAGCVKLLAVGFVFGYFWTATTAIYLLLRRDVDATEMDEIYRDADESEETAGLPPLKTDAAGAPVVADKEPKAAPAASDAPSIPSAADE